ncbi:MAG: hypothetical protein PHS92_04915 [Candidatus Gracilibacteria bacterium]|nr:hypothetical protein [Candidatus Gracilibacteria bacterium]
MKKDFFDSIAISSSDEISEIRKCRWCNEDFAIYSKDLKMLDKLSPIIDGEKFSLIAPDMCPDCRQMNRLIFRNERKYYNAKCDKCGKNEISIVSPESGKKIMCVKCWQEEDFSKYSEDYKGNFNDSLKNLFDKVPYLSRMIINMENADYCNQETDDKNCYLNAGGHFNEDSFYNTYSIHGKDTVDNYWVIENEIVWQSINIYNSSKVFYSQFIEGSHDIYFSNDLKGCKNVIFGHGLVNDEYVYKNERLEKPEWEMKAKEFKDRLKTYDGFLSLIKEHAEFMNIFPRKNVWNLSSENVIGNENTQVKDGFLVTVGEIGENVRYGHIYMQIKDSMDIEANGWSEKSYNVSSSMKMNSGIVVSHNFSESRNINYSYYSNGGSDYFGCFGLNNKSCHILNKEYPKKEYDEMIKKIIIDMINEGKWGNFFDPMLSPYPFNDSVAMEYFPVNKIIFIDDSTKKIIKEIISDERGRGTVYVLEPKKFISDAILDLGGDEKIRIRWRTSETEINVSSSIETIKAEDLPNDISETNEDILKKAIICGASGRLFRIIKPEFDFHKKYGLPLPRVHPDVRHMNKMKRKSGRKIYPRICDKCSKDILSVHPETSDFNVYCEQCYKKEVY